jgi:hypothetical protein
MINKKAWLVALGCGGIMLLTCLAACSESDPQDAEIQNQSQAAKALWRNPLTATEVELPTGWRASPAHARKGQTTIGYFKPKPRLVLASAYTHVTLHHEAEVELGLDQFLEQYIEVMEQYQAEVGTVSKGRQGQWQTASLLVQVPMKGRQAQRLQTRFWTADEREYWYAVVESPWDDSTTVYLAEPLLELLRQSSKRQTP